MNSLFVTKVLYRISVLNHHVKDQFEEQTLLLNAADEAEAWMLSMEQGKAREQSFMNANRHIMDWKLEGVANITKIEWPSGDHELFSEIRDDYTDDQQQSMLQRIQNIKSRLNEIPQLQ